MEHEAHLEQLAQTLHSVYVRRLTTNDHATMVMFKPWQDLPPTVQQAWVDVARMAVDGGPMDAGAAYQEYAL